MSHTLAPARPRVPSIGDPRPQGNRAEQKQLGAFYTPTALSDMLVNWALRHADDTVLEPGFGGCGFIDSALRRLRHLGCPAPAEQVFGCDIDQHAFDVLRTTLPATVVERHFPESDFLDCSPLQTWPERFSAAVGNPPYVSFQSLGGDCRTRYQEVMRKSGFNALPARASLWAYFVLHAASFLQPGGRAAWVLPGSLLQANYAQVVRAHLQRRFQRILVARVHERLFLNVGADEETVVLLAEGYRQDATEQGQPCVIDVNTLPGLQEAIAAWESAPSLVPEVDTHIVTESRPWQRRLPRGRIEVPSRTVGETVRIRIGLVTGDNRFFVLSTEEAKARGLPLKSLRAILSKFSMISGATLTSDDMDRAAETGERAWLVSTPKLPCRSTRVTRYLQSYCSEKLSRVSTFRKRSVWHAIEDGRPPDAFWPVMRDEGPALVLNNAGVNCTNTIHRAYRRPEASQEDLLLTVLGVASTYGQLSAEMKGRHYGSGVLKHEPREAESIRVPWVLNAEMPALLIAVAELDARLRDGQRTDARRTADEFFRQHDPNYSINYIRRLDSMLCEFRHQRVPMTRRSNLAKNQPKQTPGRYPGTPLGSAEASRDNA